MVKFAKHWKVACMFFALAGLCYPMLSTADSTFPLVKRVKCSDLPQRIFQNNSGLILEVTVQAVDNRCRGLDKLRVRNTGLGGEVNQHYPFEGSHAEAIMISVQDGFEVFLEAELPESTIRGVFSYVLSIR